eukprot:TRINITY_DN3002_c0_g4_i1.p1 TRINITY_DN3002_c0_g4~~TRINITY_DN3002_c0_g4_i1.p1  ORF type:complete len:255 (-),score=64.31 TRINITY_DN3002_c0_g4_i1:72-779(-)
MDVDHLNKNLNKPSSQDFVEASSETVLMVVAEPVSSDPDATEGESRADEEAKMTFVPTKVDYCNSTRGNCSAVGLVVGAVLGVPLLIPGVIASGTLGLLLGGVIGTGAGKLREKVKLRKYKSEQFKKFPKPTKRVDSSCQEPSCTVHFSADRIVEVMCGLCGELFCPDHVPHQAYLVYEGSDSLKCRRFCTPCWIKNGGSPHHRLVVKQKSSASSSSKAKGELPDTFLDFDFDFD